MCLDRYEKTFPDLISLGKNFGSKCQVRQDADGVFLRKGATWPGFERIIGCSVDRDRLAARKSVRKRLPFSNLFQSSLIFSIYL